MACSFTLDKCNLIRYHEFAAIAKRTVLLSILPIILSAGGNDILILA